MGAVGGVAPSIDLRRLTAADPSNDKDLSAVGATDPSIVEDLGAVDVVAPSTDFRTLSAETKHYSGTSLHSQCSHDKIIRSDLNGERAELKI